jgi:hypothetical protein
MIEQASPGRAVIVANCDYIRGMNEKPKFHTKMIKDGRWTVAVTTGYGPKSHVGDFATEEEAQRWITKDSAAWLSTLDGDKT